MYSYTFGGKNGQKNTLLESNDRVVVRTRNARSLENAVFTEAGKETLSEFNVELEFPEADITVLKAKVEPTQSLTSQRDSARAALKQEEEIRFAGRVLIDEKSKAPVLYTENIFIKFFDHISADTCEQIIAGNNLIIKQKLEYAPNSYFVSAPENTGLLIFEIAESLLKKSEVELCHPELIRKKSLKTINAAQWHLQQATVNGQAVSANVRADKAHLLSQGQNITIAVIDDGVDIDHKEFNIPGKVVSSRDITMNTNDPRHKDQREMHGTACAGVAAASGVSASGVAPKATLMPIRLASNLGSIAEANAFKWAVDHGADVISCSWGPEDGDWFNPADPLHTTPVLLPDSTRLAIEDAVSRGRGGKGCVILFAAGNGNEDVKFDGYASFSKVIAVAACNDTNKRSVYSDFGDSVWCAFPSSDFGHVPFNHPNAITNGIFTTDRSGNAGYNLAGDYTDDFGGTSSSCPGAAGTVALILSANPELTWDQVKSILKETSEKIDVANGAYGPEGHSKFYGYGKVNAEEAVKKALALKQIQPVDAIKIIAALVDPDGEDVGRENVSILNTSADNIDLSGWVLDIKGKTQNLTLQLNGGQAATVQLDNSKVKLANTGSSIVLRNAQQQLVHQVAYVKKQVKRGLAVTF
jgi:subtilisin family serine protease